MAEVGAALAPLATPISASQNAMSIQKRADAASELRILPIRCAVPRPEEAEADERDDLDAQDRAIGREQIGPPAVDGGAQRATQWR